MFKEMTHDELMTVDGGDFGVTLGIIAGAIAIYCAVDAVVEGYKDAEAGVYNHDGRYGK